VCCLRGRPRRRCNLPCTVLQHPHSGYPRVRRHTHPSPDTTHPYTTYVPCANRCHPPLHLSSLGLPSRRVISSNPKGSRYLLDHNHVLCCLIAYPAKRVVKNWLQHWHHTGPPDTRSANPLTASLFLRFSPAPSTRPSSVHPWHRSPGYLFSFSRRLLLLLLLLLLPLPLLSLSLCAGRESSHQRSLPTSPRAATGVSVMRIGATST
jgi:hypothetical protein